MEKKTQNYKDLAVWQKGINLAKATYRLTAKFPGEEKFGLVSQMRRAAISIPSNIEHEGPSSFCSMIFVAC